MGDKKGLLALAGLAAAYAWLGTHGRLTVRTEPSNAYVRVTSDVTGEVVMDCVSPCSKVLAIGPYTIVASKEGYRDAYKSVYLDPMEHEVVDLVLEPIQPPPQPPPEQQWCPGYQATQQPLNVLVYVALSSPYYVRIAAQVENYLPYLNMRYKVVSVLGPADETDAYGCWNWYLRDKGPWDVFPGLFESAPSGAKWNYIECPKNVNLQEGRICDLFRAIHSITFNEGDLRTVYGNVTAAVNDVRNKLNAYCEYNGRVLNKEDSWVCRPPDVPWVFLSDLYLYKYEGYIIR